jgi:predicted nucleic acid-binding protein
MSSETTPLLPTVYLETTVLSYLTARPSRDLVMAAHREITHNWWDNCRPRFRVVASQLVWREAQVGDHDAARRRLEALAPIPLLDITEASLELAEKLVELQALPERATADATHIALAVTNGIDYLLTWNCRHLANATMRNMIDRVCRRHGHEPVIICTPEELLEE